MGIHLNFLPAPLVEIVMDPVGQVLQFLDQLPGSLNPPAVAFEMPELVGDEIRRFTEPSDPIEIHGLPQDLGMPALGNEEGGLLVAFLGRIFTRSCKREENLLGPGF